LLLPALLSASWEPRRPGPLSASRFAATGLCFSKSSNFFEIHAKKTPCMPGTVRLCIFLPFAPPSGPGVVNFPIIAEIYLFLGFTACGHCQAQAGRLHAEILPAGRPRLLSISIHLHLLRRRSREGCSAATHGRRAGRDEPRRRPAAAPSFCSSSMPSMHLNPGSRCRRAAIAAACASSSEPRSQRGEYIDRPRNPFHLCMQHAELQICVHGYQRPSAQTYDHNQLRSSIMRV